MSENSPRWPGSNGSPGLDFSPYRKPESTPSAPSTTSATSAPEAPKVSVDESTRITPTLSERAASTAKAWATTPVAGAPATSPVPPASTAPEAPSTPNRAAVTSVGDASKPAAGASSVRNRRTRKARLRLSRIDPWSVMKTSFLFAIAFGVMLVVVAFVLWSVLAGSGALESVNSLINTLIGDEDNAFRVEDVLNSSRVLGFATVVAAIDVVILTAVATLFAFLYNLSATVLGGLEVTLAED
ncbi:DUF3566 domain-containing protein [Tessaracoccus defluvii]|uniref:DUF3566 domain-containing protein n=1 Tax=Tessaracoccus defluvii TaxID=1285901 RepID=UPI0031DFFDDD